MIQSNNGGSVAVGLSNSLAGSAAFRTEFCNVMICSKTDTGANIFGLIMYKWYKSGDWDMFDHSYDMAAVLNNGI